MPHKFIHTACVSLMLCCMAGVAAACDRECLSGTLTDFLNALVDDDPGSLDLADSVRITEDSIEKPIEAVELFRSVTKIGDYRQDFLDEADGVAGAHVIVEESGAPIMLVVRLRVIDERISEMETVATRNQADGAIFNIDALERPTEVMQYLPGPEQRATRGELIRIAMHYPAGLVAGSFDLIDAPFSREAYRLENGAMMAGPSCTRGRGCDNIKTQPLGRGRVVDTRVAAVDEHMGIVWLRMSWGRGQDRKLAVWEAFKIYDGRIHAVEAFMKVLPADLGSGWD